MNRKMFFFLLATLAYAGQIRFGVELDSDSATDVTSWFFTLQLETVLQINSYLLIDFAKEAQIILPDGLSECQSVLGFSANPACIVVSETQILVPCTNIMQKSFPDLSFRIAGLRNPPSARTLTKEVKVTSKHGARINDVSIPTNIQIKPRTLPPTEAKFIAANPTVGALTTLTVSLTVVSPVATDGKLIIGFPKWSANQSMLNQLESCEAETFERSISINRKNCTMEFENNTNSDKVIVSGAFGVAIQLGQRISITFTHIRSLPTLAPKSDFAVFTADSKGRLIEQVVNALMPLQHTARQKAWSKTGVRIGDDTGMSAYGTYNFMFKLGLPLERDSSLRITLPAEVENSDTFLLTFKGVYNIQPRKPKEGISSKHLTLSGCFGEYLPANSTIQFQIKGLKNPKTVVPSTSFILETLDVGQYGVELFDKNLTVQSSPGALRDVFFVPMYRLGIYDFASEFRLSFTLENDLDSSATIVLQVPTVNQTSAEGGQNLEFEVNQDRDCSVIEGGDLFDKDFTCTVSKRKNTIVLGQILRGDKKLQSGMNITLKMGNLQVRNPGSVRAKARLRINTTMEGYVLDSALSQVFTPVPEPLSKASVKPDDLLTSSEDVAYTFTIQAGGPIPQGAYITVDFPAEVGVPSTAQVRSCSEHQIGGVRQKQREEGGKLVNPRIKCTVSDQQVQVRDLFAFGNTREFAYIKFTVPGVTNPRAARLPISSFKINVFEDESKAYHMFFQENDVAAVMKRANKFKSAIVSRSSEVNNAQTDYIFELQTFAEIEQNDRIIIKFPDGIELAKKSECVGYAPLEKKLTCVRYQGDRLGVYLNFGEQVGRRLQAGTRAIRFAVKKVKNPNTNRPTESFSLTQITSTGFEVSKTEFGVPVANTKAFPLAAYDVEIRPRSFETDVTVAYDVTIVPRTFQQNMYIEMMLPRELTPPSEKITCEKGVGTEQTIKCEYIAKERKIRVMDAFSTSFKRPDQIKFAVFNLKNPPRKITTRSFNTTTFTFDGYKIDQLARESTINFVCARPCRTCSGGLAMKCESCFKVGSRFSNKPILHENQCLADCPHGLFYERTTSRCKSCHSKTCGKCSGPGVLDCIACQENTKLVDGDCISLELTERVHFFPFAILSAIWFAVCVFLANYSSKDDGRNFNFLAALLVGWCPISMAMVVFETYFYYALNFIVAALFSLACGIIYSILLSILFLIVVCACHKGTAFGSHFLIYPCETTTSLISAFLGSTRTFKLIYAGWGQSTNGCNLIDFRKNAPAMKNNRTLKSINAWFSFLSLISDAGLIVAALQVVTQVRFDVRFAKHLATERLIISICIFVTTLLEQKSKWWVFGGIGKNRIHEESVNSEDPRKPSLVGLTQTEHEFPQDKEGEMSQLSQIQLLNKQDIHGDKQLTEENKFNTAEPASTQEQHQVLNTLWPNSSKKTTEINESAVPSKQNSGRGNFLINVKAQNNSRLVDNELIEREISPVKESSSDFYAEKGEYPGSSVIATPTAVLPVNFVSEASRQSKLVSLRSQEITQMIKADPIDIGVRRPFDEERKSVLQVSEDGKVNVIHSSKGTDMNSQLKKEMKTQEQFYSDASGLKSFLIDTQGDAFLCDKKNSQKDLDQVFEQHEEIKESTMSDNISKINKAGPKLKRMTEKPYESEMREKGRYDQNRLSDNTSNQIASDAVRQQLMTESPSSFTNPLVDQSKKADSKLKKSVPNTKTFKTIESQTSKREKSPYQNSQTIVSKLSEQRAAIKQSLGSERGASRTKKISSGSEKQPPPKKMLRKSSQEGKIGVLQKELNSMRSQVKTLEERVITAEQANKSFQDTYTMQMTNLQSARDKPVTDMGNQADLEQEQQQLAKTATKFHSASAKKPASKFAIQTELPDENHMIQTDEKELQLKQAKGSPRKKTRERGSFKMYYSDRSDTSYEVGMGITPTDFNIENGRFAGDSVGLKNQVEHSRSHFEGLTQKDTPMSTNELKLSKFSFNRQQMISIEGDDPRPQVPIIKQIPSFEQLEEPFHPEQLQNLPDVEKYEHALIRQKEDYMAASRYGAFSMNPINFTPKHEMSGEENNSTTPQTATMATHVNSSLHLTTQVASLKVAPDSVAHEYDDSSYTGAMTKDMPRVGFMAPAPTSFSQAQLQQLNAERNQAVTGRSAVINTKPILKSSQSQHRESKQAGKSARIISEERSKKADGLLFKPPPSAHYIESSSRAPKAKKAAPKQKLRK